MTDEDLPRAGQRITADQMAEIQAHLREREAEQRKHAGWEDRFGQRMRAEREKRGWSQVQLAERLRAHGVDLHPSAVAKMEHRDVERPRVIRLDEASAIAAAFDLTLDQMLTTAADILSTAVMNVVQWRLGVDLAGKDGLKVSYFLRDHKDDIYRLVAEGSESAMDAVKEIGRSTLQIERIAEAIKASAEILRKSFGVLTDEEHERDGGKSVVKVPAWIADSEKVRSLLEEHRPWPDEPDPGGGRADG